MVKLLKYWQQIKASWHEWLHKWGSFKKIKERISTKIKLKRINRMNKILWRPNGPAQQAMHERIMDRAALQTLKQKQLKFWKSNHITYYYRNNGELDMKIIRSGLIIQTPHEDQKDEQ